MKERPLQLQVYKYNFPVPFSVNRMLLFISPFCNPIMFMTIHDRVEQKLTLLKRQVEMYLCSRLAVMSDDYQMPPNI